MTTNHDWVDRIIRTLVQLIVAGVFTELTRQVIADLPAAYSIYAMIVWTAVVTAAQNYAEAHGIVPTVLKPGPPETK